MCILIAMKHVTMKDGDDIQITLCEIVILLLLSWRNWTPENRGITDPTKRSNVLKDFKQLEKLTDLGATRSSFSSSWVCSRSGPRFVLVRPRTGSSRRDMCARTTHPRPSRSPARDRSTGAQCSFEPETQCKSEFTLRESDLLRVTDQQVHNVRLSLKHSVKVSTHWEKAICCVWQINRCRSTYSLVPFYTRLLKVLVMVPWQPLKLIVPMKGYTVIFVVNKITKLTVTMSLVRLCEYWAADWVKEHCSNEQYWEKWAMFCNTVRLNEQCLLIKTAAQYLNRNSS